MSIEVGGRPLEGRDSFFPDALNRYGIEDDEFAGCQNCVLAFGHRELKGIAQVLSRPFAMNEVAQALWHISPTVSPDLLWGNGDVVRVAASVNELEDDFDEFLGLHGSTIAGLTGNVNPLPPSAETRFCTTGT